MRMNLSDEFSIHQQKLPGILRCFVVALLVAGVWMLTACTQTQTPVVTPIKEDFLPTAEIVETTVTPTVVTPSLQTDPRILKLGNKLGLALVDQECVAPCAVVVQTQVGDGSPLTLGELVEKLGPPEKLNANLCCAEDVYFYVELFYVHEGFTVRAKRRLKDNITDMTPDMTVFAIELWQSHTLEGIAKEFDEEFGIGVGTIVLQAQDWKGFGKVR